MNSTTKSPGFIYAIQSRHIKLIKIGYTRDVLTRLSHLQCGSADALDLICSWEGTVEDERSLHLALAKWRTHGEWFTPSDEVLSVLEKCSSGYLSSLTSRKNHGGKEKPLDAIQAESAATIVVLMRELQKIDFGKVSQVAAKAEFHALALLRGQKPQAATSTGAES